MNSRKTTSAIIIGLFVIAMLCLGLPVIFKTIINKASQNAINPPESSSFRRRDVPVKTGQTVIEREKNPNELFGFIRSIREKDGTLYAEFDLAEWITNDHSPTSTPESVMAADLAAAEDSKCGYTPEEVTVGACAPNGFYIRNNSTSTRLLPISPDAIIESYFSTSGTFLNEDGTWKLTRISAEELMKTIETLNSDFGLIYDVSLKDGMIWKMAERYVP